MRKNNVNVFKTFWTLKCTCTRGGWKQTWSTVLSLSLQEALALRYTESISFGGSCVCRCLRLCECELGSIMRERQTGRHNREKHKEGEKNTERDKIRTIRLHPTWWWGPPDPQASSSLKTEQGHIAPPYNPGSPSHEDFLCANTQTH